jgi:predicted RecA/RadA family phage recombinase
MATNYTQDGQSITWANGTGSPVASGDPVVIGTQLGVAITDIADTESGAVFLGGVFSIPKSTGSAIAIGAAVDYDISTAKVNGSITPATGDLIGCGVAWAAAASADTTVLVKLNAAGASVTT